MGNAKSLIQVNKAIQAKYPLIKLVKGKGYYYVHSEDDNISLQLAALFSTSIPVANIKHQSVDNWIKDVESVLSDWERFHYDRVPVKF